MDPHETHDMIKHDMIKPEESSSPPVSPPNTPFPHQLIDLVSHARRRLSHNPIYAPNLFGYQAILDQITYHASLNHSNDETSHSIQRAMMQEMKRVDMFYNQRLADIKAQLEALKIQLPSPSSTKPSLSNLAWAFAHLLYEHHHALYTRVVAQTVRDVVDLEAASYSYHDADHAAMKADGMTIEWLDQLKALMHVAESIDMLRQFCMTTAVEACAITALTYDSDDCFWQVHPMALQPYAKGDGLHSLNAVLQQIFDGFLPRQSESGLCPVSHTPTLAPVILTTCSHRFDLLSFYPFFGRNDNEKRGKCPVCDRVWDGVHDQLVADSSLTKLDFIRGNAAPPFPMLNPQMNQPMNPAMMQMPNNAHLNDVLKAASNAGTTVNVTGNFKPYKSDEGEDVERGVSCHQCKTNKPKSALLFCTTKADGLRKRRCRKKYCDSCLRRSYNQSISTMSTEELMSWVCPSCTKSCTCAACVRRTPGRRDTEGEQYMFDHQAPPLPVGMNGTIHEDGQPQSPTSAAHAGNHNVRAGAGAAAAHQLNQNQLGMELNQLGQSHLGQNSFGHNSFGLNQPGQNHPLNQNHLNQLHQLNHNHQMMTMSQPGQPHSMESLASMFSVPPTGSLIPSLSMSMPTMSSQSNDLPHLSQTGEQQMSRPMMPISTNPADQAD